MLTDWLWSTALYGGTLVAAAGAVGIIRPFKRLHRRSRRRALVMLLLGVAVVMTVRSITPAAATSTTHHGIDEFLPVFHFRERHERLISAPPDRVFAAVKAVTADEIALFKSFTWLRRFGREGPEGLLNPPRGKPIFEVAVTTGFTLLLDRAPQEIVLGVVLVAPRGVDRGEFAVPERFRMVSQPGFARAAINFRVEPDGRGSRLITETRVHSTDAAALAMFTPYWRTIFPGSAILRITWLAAIKARAERAAS